MGERGNPARIMFSAPINPPRVSAGQLFVSMIPATHTEQPMALASPPWIVRYANQLPDPTEPFTDSRVVDFLNQLGRGNWLLIDRSPQTTLLGLLFQMNDAQNLNRSPGLSNATVRVTTRCH